MSNRHNKRTQEHPVKQHNYMRKLLYMYRVGAIPRSVGLHQVDIFHDDWCRVYTGTWCNCNPEITLRWSQPAAAKN